MIAPEFWLERKISGLFSDDNTCDWQLKFPFSENIRHFSGLRFQAFAYIRTTARDTLRKYRMCLKTSHTVFVFLYATPRNTMIMNSLLDGAAYRRFITE